MTMAIREIHGRAKPYSAQSRTRVTTGHTHDGARRNEISVKARVPRIEPMMSQR